MGGIRGKAKNPPSFSLGPAFRKDEKIYIYRKTQKAAREELPRLLCVYWPSIDVKKEEGENHFMSRDPGKGIEPDFLYLNALSLTGKRNEKKKT